MENILTYYMENLKNQAVHKAVIDNTDTYKNKTVVKMRKKSLKMLKKRNKKLQQALIEEYYNEHLKLLKENDNEDRVHPGE